MSTIPPKRVLQKTDRQGMNSRHLLFIYYADNNKNSLFLDKKAGDTLLAERSPAS